jgi:glycopeptide antibiotics resistance protein
MRETARKIFWWGLVGAYGAFLPYARRAWNALFGRRSPWFDYMPAAISVALAAIVIFLLARRRERRPSVYVAIAVIAVLYYFLFQFVSLPIERIHMGEYGFITFLIVLALACYSPAPIIYVWAVIVAIHIGIVDELIQGCLQERYYDIKDVWLNAWACFLGACVIAFVVRPGRVHGEG